MRCDECSAELHMVVDGVEMSKEQLKRLSKAPKEIKHYMNHQPWCKKGRANV